MPRILGIDYGTRRVGAALSDPGRTMAFPAEVYALRQLAALTRTFGAWLAGVTGLPVFYFDERYTTVEAEHRLIEAGLKRQKRKALRDQLAAQIMLQGYLDAGCPETEAKAAPLADDPEINP
jgi:putative holliday junction resolvase